jgi:hypothetical protein
MTFFSRSYDLPPLIVVRSVDREKTLGIFAVVEEREPERLFVATQIVVKGGARVLQPDPVRTTFYAVVEETLGFGTATGGTRRIRFQQIGYFAPDLSYSRSLAART